jgi:metal-responsive CopG/Arc/MetJ family transcriptional regulator
MEVAVRKRGAGRPSKGERAFVGIRIPLNLLAAIDHTRAGLSRSEFCAELFRKVLKRHVKSEKSETIHS